ncbi:hypothetical protein [Micromonospora sp. C28ISP2-4]|uniref:hypothetical protein n=1 Tax=Micromonospora sp. C28ISP2-4 TaxID=3059523 RepID=UPI002675F25E|nr:hypothetical protein [Micromonospora sp. C28ISP2-4]MDO3687683.1 hypothetical protein [Micromonospora sp. C28ISP2-4]
MSPQQRDRRPVEAIRHLVQVVENCASSTPLQVQAKELLDTILGTQACMMRGVILYGPPAAGKDTITRALTDADPADRLFRRLKAGPGRTAGYRMTTADKLKELRSRGEVAWENDRYGARYIVDRPALRRDLTDYVPVVHLGQTEAVDASGPPSKERMAHRLRVSRRGRCLTNPSHHITDR